MFMGKKEERMVKLVAIGIVLLFIGTAVVVAVSVFV